MPVVSPEVPRLKTADPTTKPVLAYWFPPARNVVVVGVLAATPELELFSADLWPEIVQTVSRTGGHLASSLGVVELTLVLHYLFESPADRIVWDVGHQAYAHKLLTGRREQFGTIRLPGGLFHSAAIGQTCSFSRPVPPEMLGPGLPAGKP